MTNQSSEISPGLSALVTRRSFLGQTALLGGAAAAGSWPRLQAAESAGNKLVAGVMGLGRGLDHIRALQQISDVEVAWVCDVDDQRLARAAKLVGEKQARAAKTARDFRQILDDRTVDVLFIAAPNFWHTPATMLACADGKHVYVEKPGSGTAQECEWVGACARKHKRVVQMGTQRRSWPGVIEAIEKLQGGVIGRVLYARCWYNNARGSIGKGKQVPVPPSLDYTLWQGPLTERPYVDNLVHYNWHWRWHWGNGELGNNGIHALDIARWGLGVDYPVRVTYNGGRYHFEDDQETPDTGVAVYDFGGKGVSWEHSSCLPRKQEPMPFVSFYGEGGTLVQDGSGYKVYDPAGKLAGSGTGPGGDKVHIENFLTCVRTGKRPNADISECQKSTLLCHLGNIAYRTGGSLRFDPAARRMVGGSEAQALWGREYRPGWEPKV